MTKKAPKEVAAAARARKDRLAPITQHTLPKGMRVPNGVGVASACVCDDIDVAVASDMMLTPSTQYAKQELKLPLTDDEIQLYFGDTVNPLSPTSGVGPQGRITSLVETDTVPCDILVKGIGLYFKVEPFVFEMNGTAIDLPDPNTDTPALTDTPAFDAEGTDRPAILKWGTDAWRAVFAFLESYDLEFYVGCKYQLLCEHLADIGYVSANDAVLGSGNSLVAAHPWIRKVNDRVRATDGTQIFVPATVDDDDNPLPPPMVPAVWGGPQYNGCYQGIFPLKTPLVLTRGMPIRAQFRRTINEVMYYERLVEAVGIEESITYDENLTETIAGDLGYANVIPFKGGQITVGLLFKAWELTPRACVEFANDFVFGVGAPNATPAQKQRAVSRSNKYTVRQREMLTDLYTSDRGTLTALQGYAAQVAQYDKGFGLAGAPSELIRS